MSIIEQAAKRLEQLQRAGVEMPWAPSARVESPLPATEPAAPAPVAPTLAGAATLGRPARSHPKPAATVALDLDGLREAGFLAPDQVRSHMAHQFRHIKLPLLMNARPKADAPDQRGSLIMVTSALSNEGKTFCAINLAISMAMEVDTSVLLIDADLIRPSLFARLGVTAEVPGLMDLLTRNDLGLHDAIVATNVPKLSLMSTGDLSDRSTELLESAAMDRLLTRLAEDYADHLIIFDAPPLLLTTESAVLAAKVGQVVVVVEAGKTPRASVQEAFGTLRDCPIVLTVLNKCEQPGEGQRYGYYYG